MTQDELRTFVLRLRCCSSDKAYQLATKLINGSKCNTKELTMLNGIITSLLPYVVDSENNCLTEDEYTTVVDTARQICKLCDCE